MRPAPSLLALALLALPLLAANQCQEPGTSTDVSDHPHRVVLEAGPDLEGRLRRALVGAQPGTVVDLPAGTWSFSGALTVQASHVVIRGQGMMQTILDFSGQQFGSQAILGLGDHFTVEDFSILDPSGDGVKTQGITGATFRRVRVEWTGGPSVQNGAYGLYPAENSDVLVEGCIVKGARDAGIYVGQSANVIVQRNHVEQNVLGIEIENTVDADVLLNTATGNTAGIAVFNLPDLLEGHGVRVIENAVWDNDEPNFAAGGILALVPGGTGIVGIAPRDLEIARNEIWGNDSANMVISAFFISLEDISDAVMKLRDGQGTIVPYEPFAYAEKVWVHDNAFGAGGQSPAGLARDLRDIFFPTGMPDIVIGGWADQNKIPNFDPAGIPFVSQVLPENKICLQGNVDAVAGHGNGLFIAAFDPLDVSAFDCTHPARPAVTLPERPPVPETPPPLSPAETAALCNAPGSGVNWAAYLANCPDLADYRLFQGVDPRVAPNPGGVPYDLTTPLFSDYAAKDRFVFLPPGTAMSYVPDGPFVFPEGTIIVKTFSFQDTSGPTLLDTLVETRLLIKRDDGWHGLPYIWDAAATSATYRPEGGVARNLTVTDPSGTTHLFDYHIPDAGECGACHFGSAGDVPIGPTARLLNRDLDYGGGVVENQLVQLSALGFLSGAPADPAQAPRAPVWNDPHDGTREERARAYLDVNCAHCHNPQGRAGFTSLYLTHDQPVGRNLGVCKRPIAAGAGALGKLWDIDPGRPLESILLLRMAVGGEEPGVMMPEISKSLVHDPGVQLVSDWIEFDLAPLAGSCQ